MIPSQFFYQSKVVQTGYINDICATVCRNHILRSKRYRLHRHRRRELDGDGGGGPCSRRWMQCHFPKVTGECHAPAAHIACLRIPPPRETRVQAHAQSDHAHQQYRIAQMNTYVLFVIIRKDKFIYRYGCIFHMYLDFFYLRSLYVRIQS